MLKRWRQRRESDADGMPTEALLSHPAVIRAHRPNVALIIRDPRDRLLWCERMEPEGVWQFPQGGVDAGEDFEAAMWREGAEELGLNDPRAVLEIEAVSPQLIRYEFPTKVIRRFLDAGFFSYIGQAQRYYLLRFHGDDALITLDPPPGMEREFRRWRWAGLELLPHNAPFKQAAYREALGALGLL